MKARGARGTVWLAAALAVLLGSWPEDGRTSEERTHLVVHEWGTFTSVVDSDGLPVTWRPFTASADLPDFVYRAEGDGPQPGPSRQRDLKARLAAPARLETPVIYFYADEATSVSAAVRFPHGRFTEWYPRGAISGEVIRWDGVQVQPGASAAFPDDGSGSHYYAARETDAAPLRVEGEAGPQEEKFLFYRGVGSLELSVRATLQAGRVVVQPLAAGVREVILFERRDGEVGYSVQELGRGPVAIEPRGQGQDLAVLKSELERMLVRHGLHPQEAAAMVATWGDSWFEEGTRLFYVLPRPVADRSLPLTVTPRPEKTVRVLVGRLELIRPEDEQRASAELDGLADVTTLTAEDKDDVRTRLGRFGEPTLRRLWARRADPVVRAKIEALLAR